MNLTMPLSCPDCDGYNTEPIGMEPGGNGAHHCQDCGMIWSPGKFRNLYTLPEERSEFGYTGDDGEKYALEDTDPLDPDFTPCPLCCSTQVVGLVKFGGELSGRYMCQTCGCEFSIFQGCETSDGMGDYIPEEEEEDRIQGRWGKGSESDCNVHGVITICPHCRAIDSIMVWGDSEWCEKCWLNPNDLEQPSPFISKLYKGAIAKALEEDISILKANRLHGKFIREECGPHCSLSEACPQEVGNLVVCFREGLSSEEGDEEAVGKRRRGKKKNQRKKKNRRGGITNFVKQHNQKWRKEKPPEVAFFCSKGGLLEKMVLHGNEDQDTEQSGDTGSQSGT